MAPRKDEAAGALTARMGTQFDALLELHPNTTRQSSIKVRDRHHVVR